MLKWSFAFLIIALIAGALGYTGIAGTAAGIAQALFFIFIGLWLAVLIAGYLFIKR